MTNTTEGSRPPERERPTAEEMVARRSHYLDDYSDEIPEQRIIGGGDYKVRGNWFQGAFSTTKFILHVYLNNPALWNKVTEFEERFRARRVAAYEAMKRGEQPDSFTPTTREENEAHNCVLRNFWGVRRLRYRGDAAG